MKMMLIALALFRMKISNYCNAYTIIDKKVINEKQKQKK